MAHRRREPLLYPIPSSWTCARLMEIGGLNGIDARRMINAGAVTLRCADRIACHLGTHIDTMWPEVAWIDAFIEADLERLRSWVRRWRNAA